MRNKRRKSLKSRWVELKAANKILVVAVLLLLIYPLCYLLFNVAFVILFIFKDFIPTGTHETIWFHNINLKDDEMIHIKSNDITKKWYVQKYSFPFNKTLLESSKEIGYLGIINDSTEDVGVVVMYINPNIFGPRIIEFFEYGNLDSVGIYYYYWGHYLKNPKIEYEDTLYIHRKDKYLYKQCDTIYLKPYL